MRDPKNIKIRLNSQSIIGLIGVFAIVVFSIWIALKYDLEVIVSIAAIATAVIACTWVVARYTHQGQIEKLKIQLEFYEKHKDVNISEVIKAIDKFVSKANLELECNQLKQENQNLIDQINKTSEKMRSYKNEYEKIRSQLIILEEDFTLEEKESHFIFNQQICIAVLKIRQQGVEVIYNGKERLWKIGEQEIETIGNFRYRITLTKINFLTQEVKFKVEKLPNN